MKNKHKLPEYVYPLGIRHQVQLLLEVRDAEDCVGLTLPELRVIQIKSTQDRRRLWTTLLHEYIHASLAVAGIGNVLSEELEECVAQSLEHSLEQFMLAHGQEFLDALDVLR